MRDEMDRAATENAKALEERRLTQEFVDLEAELKEAREEAAKVKTELTEEKATRAMVEESTDMFLKKAKEFDARAMTLEAEMRLARASLRRRRTSPCLGRCRWFSMTEMRSRVLRSGWRMIGTSPYTRLGMLPGFACRMR